MIITQVGDCCTGWVDNHEQDIAQLAARSAPQRDRRLALDAGPDLSTYTDTRTHATAGSALVLHLRSWQAGLMDLYYTLPYERVGLAFVRLRRLEQQISGFRTGRGDVLRSYRSLLKIEKELRGAYYRAGTARAISRHVLSDLGAFEILDAVRQGVSMLGERAGMRASARAARASNRIALVALIVAVIAAIPAMPAILGLIDQQRAANPDATVWSIIQTLATTPLLLSAVILGAVLLYLVVLFIVLIFRVGRYLLAARRQGYISRIDGHELTIGDPENLGQPDVQP